MPRTHVDSTRTSHEKEARDAKKLDALRAKGAQPFPTAFDHPGSLAEAFRGSDAVFGFLPPGYDQDDLRAWQERVGEATIAALRQTGVRSIVNLSSLGADQTAGTGPILGLHLQEQRLDALAGVDVVHLRPGYFMENHLWAIPAIRQSGVHPSPLRADLAIHMVATRDIALKAAELLDALAFRGSSVVEFVGPRAVTMRAATAALGKAIGKPDLAFVQAPMEEARKAMLAMGLEPKIVELMLEMMGAMNAGKVEPRSAITPDRRGKTTIEGFARVFAQAYPAA